MDDPHVSVGKGGIGASETCVAAAKHRETNREIAGSSHARASQTQSDKPRTDRDYERGLIKPSLGEAFDPGAAHGFLPSEEGGDCNCQK